MEGELERHPRIVIMVGLLAIIFHIWFTLPASFTVGSLLLAYGVTALAHASHTATLAAVGIALLCSLLFWGRYLVWILTRHE